MGRGDRPSGSGRSGNAHSGARRSESGHSFGVDLDSHRDDFSTGEPKPRRKRRRTLSRKSFVSGRTAILFGVIITAVLLLSLPMREYFRQGSDISYANTEAAKLQVSVDKLQEQVDRWNSDAYIREQARERLNYVMPNEQAYVVVGSEQVKSEPEERAERKSQKGAWFEELWGSVKESDTAGLGQRPDAEFPHIVR